MNSGNSRQTTCSRSTWGGKIDSDWGNYRNYRLQNKYEKSHGNFHIWELGTRQINSYLK